MCINNTQDRLTKNTFMIVSIIVCACICIFFDAQTREELTYKKETNDAEVSVFANLYEGEKITQTLERPLKQIKAITIEIPTWGKQSFLGELCIRVMNNGLLVGEKVIDGKFIYDNYVARVDLFDCEGEIGDKFQIVVTSTNAADSPIALWIYSENQEFNAYMTHNDGEQVLGTTALGIVYENCNVSSIWWVFITWCAIIACSILRKNKKWENYINRKILVYVLLCCAGFFVLLLRGGVFSYSQMYGEDAVYLSNIINNGFFESAFSTRRGGNADFLNLGSYILLEVAWLINKAVYGYNLLHLPVVVGVISSFFGACAAVYAFHVMKKINCSLGVFAYFVTIAIPVGTDTAEVFGRVVNTIYIFTFFAVLMLVDIWDERFVMQRKNCIYGVLILVCGLTFPISYVALGMYLLFGVWDALKTEKFKNFFKCNITMFCTFGVGVLMLPTMIGSQGLAEGLETKVESLIEFIFARHMIYPFVYLFYKGLNDLVVVAITVAILAIILTAIYMEYKEKGKFDKYALMSFATIFSILSSAIVRLPMSSLFETYTSTFPDRYYYICNILFLIMTMYGIYVINVNLKGKIHELYNGVIIVVMFSMLVNSDMFFCVGKDDEFLLELGSAKNYNWEESLEETWSDNRIDGGNYVISTNPVGESWTMRIPSVYVLSSIDELQEKE